MSIAVLVLWNHDVRRSDLLHSSGGCSSVQSQCLFCGITISGGQTSFIAQEVLVHLNRNDCFVESLYQEVRPPAFLRWS